MSKTSDIVLQASGISKTFPGVKALDNVQLTLRRGKLTALLGENGAGKSTLMNIIAGVFPPDEGVIKVGGEVVRFSNTRDAHAAGIGMVFQELNLVENMTVAENLFLGREPLNRIGWVDSDAMNRQASALLKELDLDVKPTTLLGSLRVGQQQIVEIAKTISTNARILIMDEPTSAITEHEIEVLFKLIHDLKEKGVAIVYITHKLEELEQIGDDAVIMRDGRCVGVAPLDELSHNDIIHMMVGREVRNSSKSASASMDVEALRIERFSLALAGTTDRFHFKNIQLKVHQGEVLGIFGLMGAGRTELLETLFGLHSNHASGEVFIKGKPVRINDPLDAIHQGIVLAPEDRKRDGLVLSMSVSENASLAAISKLETFGFLNKANERKLVGESIDRLNIKTPSQKEAIQNLSGGNQQKVVLAKWLATHPDILLLDEPTRGIDVNAKREIYVLIENLANKGLAVIVVSSELPEILALSDRIVVLSEGRKTAEFDREEVTEEKIMHAALPH